MASHRREFSWPWRTFGRSKEGAEGRGGVEGAAGRRRKGQAVLRVIWPGVGNAGLPMARVGGRGRRIRKKGKATQEERDEELVEKVETVLERMKAKVKMMRDTLVASFADVPGMEDLEERFEIIEEKFMSPEDRAASEKRRVVKKMQKMSAEEKEEFLKKKEEETMRKLQAEKQQREKEEEELRSTVEELQLYLTGAFDQELSSKTMAERKAMHPSYLNRPSAIKMQLPDEEEQKLELDKLGWGMQGNKLFGKIVPGMQEYAWAIYGNCNNARAVLEKKWAGKDPQKVLSNPTYYQDIIKHAPLMELTLMVKTAKDLSLPKFRREYGERLYRRLESYGASAAEGRALADWLGLFHEERLQGLPFMKDNKVLKGTHMIFSVNLKGELLAEVQDPRELRHRQQFKLGVCENKHISRAVFDIFLGEDAIQQQGKQSVGNGLLYALNGFTWYENPRNPRQQPAEVSRNYTFEELRRGKKEFTSSKIKPKSDQYELPTNALVAAACEGQTLKGLLVHQLSDGAREKEGVNVQHQAAIAAEERSREDESREMERKLIEALPRLIEEEAQKADELEMLGPYSPSLNRMLVSPEPEKAKEIRELSASLIAKPLRDHLIKTGQLEPGSKEDRERFQEFLKPAREEAEVSDSTVTPSASASAV